MWVEVGATPNTWVARVCAKTAVSMLHPMWTIFSVALETNKIIGYMGYIMQTYYLFNPLNIMLKLVKFEIMLQNIIVSLGSVDDQYK